MVCGKKECITLCQLDCKTQGNKIFLFIWLQKRFRKIKGQNTYWRIKFSQKWMFRSRQEGFSWKQLCFKVCGFATDNSNCIQTIAWSCDVTRSWGISIFWVLSTYNTVQGKGRYSYRLNCAEVNVCNCCPQKGSFCTWCNSNSSMSVKKFYC